MESLQLWILKFGEDRKIFCISVEIFVEWLANHNPPWSAYREFLSSRIIVLNKRPGVCLVGVGKTWWHLFDNCVLRVMGTEPTNAWKEDQIRAHSKARINGALNGVQAIWGENLSTEDWWLLLVDTKNAFNETNKTIMLWRVHHLCSSGAHFFKNFYYHWSSLVLWNRNGMDSFLHSREGVTQGHTLAIFAYGIGVLPLNKLLKEAYTDITHTWYADNASALGMFNNIGLYFNLLKQFGPGHGY